MYTFRKNELRVFKTICHGARSTDEVKRSTGISAISVYRAVQSLTSKKLIGAERTGKRLRLSRTPHGHSKALAAYLEGKKRPVEPLIGSRFLVLLSVSSNRKDLDRIAKETWLTSESVRRVVWELKGLGVVTQKGRSVSIPPSDTALVHFLKDFSKGACETVLESVAATGTVLWSEGLQFVFSARRFEDTKGVNETGMTAMSKRGIPAISDMRHYHYAYWRPRLRAEDIALHNVLIDPRNSRGVSHSLLFLIKEGYDYRYLTEQGEAVGAGALSERIVRYLGGEAVDDARFPSRSGMTRLCAQYGVR
jgi:predicted transcriptional regulator